jgi:hypothetical protein
VLFLFVALRAAAATLWQYKQIEKLRMECNANSQRLYSNVRAKIPH